MPVGMHVGGTESFRGNIPRPLTWLGPSYSRGVGTRGDAMRPYGHRRSHDYSKTTGGYWRVRASLPHVNIELW